MQNTPRVDCRDDALKEAVDAARESNAPALKLLATLKLQTLHEEQHNEDSSGAAGKLPEAQDTANNIKLVAIGAGTAAFLVVVAMILFRGRK